MSDNAGEGQTVQRERGRLSRCRGIDKTIGSIRAVSWWRRGGRKPGYTIWPAHSDGGRTRHRSAPDAQPLISRLRSRFSRLEALPAKSSAPANGLEAKDGRGETHADCAQRDIRVSEGGGGRVLGQLTRRSRPCQ